MYSFYFCYPAANEGQRRPTQAHEGPQQPTTANEGQCRPTKTHGSQRRPTKAHAAQHQPTQPHESPRQPTKANDGPRKPTAANEGQRQPTAANAGQRRPTSANEGPRKPTAANAGPRRPTAANDGQQRPTQAHEDKKGPNDARWRRLGPRYVFFFIFFILFLLLRDSGHPTRTRTPRNPYPGTRVRVFWGTGTGSPGKPQGYPCQSLQLHLSPLSASVLAMAVKLCSQPGSQAIPRQKAMYISKIIDYFSECSRYISACRAKPSATPRDNVCSFVERMEHLYGQDSNAFPTVRGRSVPQPTTMTTVPVLQRTPAVTMLWYMKMSTWARMVRRVR